MNSTTNITDQIEWKNRAVFIGPLAAYMLVATMVIAIWERIDIQLVTDDSPTVSLISVFARLLSVLAVFAWGFPHIKKVFPFQISLTCIPVGVLGAMIWIGLCRLNLEAGILSSLGLSSDLLGSRDATNPWELFGNGMSLKLFLAIRFSILIVAVPLAEELFLRGFLLRYLRDPNWTELSIDHLTGSAIGVAAIYGILTHPSEWIAAAVWFSMISLLMLHTKKFWDCVVAHAITNGLLGCYIIWFQDWRLW
ncbi:MAG: type II CAAX prenyl endopeptidase Rce1 family protein [Rubripirellula sp.]